MSHKFSGIAFRYSKSMGSSIAIHKHWSCGQSMGFFQGFFLSFCCFILSFIQSNIFLSLYLKVRDDNGFKNVPGISWPIKFALNSGEMQHAIMKKHHYTKWNGLLVVAGMCRRKWFSLDPMNLFPCKILFVT